MEKISVMIVEDHPIFRDALITAIDFEDDFVVAGDAADGESAVAMAQDIKPDVIIMDLNLPLMSGIEAIKEIVSAIPGARIMALTSSMKEEDVIRAVQAKVMGYLTKDVSQDILIKGLREISAGKLFLPENITHKLINQIRMHDQVEETTVEEGPYGQLTGREQEVLRLIGEGLSNHLIAQKLCLSQSTIRVHVFNILNKLGLEDRNQAIVYALRNQK